MSTGRTYNLRELGDRFRPTAAVAETFPRDQASSATLAALTKDNASYMGIALSYNQVVTGATFYSGTTALTTSGTGPHLWAALLDSTGKVIRQSIDDVAGSWAQNAAHAFTLDAVPVTAGARSASTTVTLTLGNLSQDLTTVLAVGDSIVVTGASIAAYNGTFTTTAVTATTIQYTAGSSATDSIASPWPTVQLPAGKRTYTVPTTGTYLVGLMVDSGSTGTQNTFVGKAIAAVPSTLAPLTWIRDATNTVLATAVTATPTSNSTGNLIYAILT